MHLLFSRITFSIYTEATKYFLSLPQPYLPIFFHSSGDFVHIIIKHKFSHSFAISFAIQSRTQTIQYQITMNIEFKKRYIWKEVVLVYLWYYP